MVRPIPCRTHGIGWCSAYWRARRRSRALLDTGLVLVVVAAIVLLLGLAAQAEEVEEQPVDIPAGAVCKGPAMPRAVPVPEGKLVPLPAWSRLDTRLRVLEAELARSRAERTEEKRQSDAAFVQGVGLAVGVGIAVGALGAWIVHKPPW